MVKHHHHESIPLHGSTAANYFSIRYSLSFGWDWIEQWKNPGWLGYTGHYTTQSYRDYNISHYKDPYKPTSIMESNEVFFFRGSIEVTSWPWWFVVKNGMNNYPQKQLPSLWTIGPWTFRILWVKRLYDIPSFKPSNFSNSETASVFGRFQTNGLRFTGFETGIYRGDGKSGGTLWLSGDLSQGLLENSGIREGCEAMMCEINRRLGIPQMVVKRCEK